MVHDSKTARIAGSIGVLFLAAVAIGACGDDEPARSLIGYAPTGRQSVVEVAMPDASHPDDDFRFRAEPGELLLVNFGYTSCPDVCPTTLSIVKSAKNQLGDDGDRVDLAIVSVDPARDTAEIMTKYVSRFVPGGHALRSDDPAQLAAAASAFGVTYSVTTAADGTIEVTHTGAMFAVDDAGEVVLTWPFGVTTDDVLGDLRILLAARG